LTPLVRIGIGLTSRPRRMYLRRAMSFPHGRWRLGEDGQRESLLIGVMFNSGHGDAVAWSITAT